ncbi:arginase family protein [Candidatus Roizmanbacteria bacterium]|nr:arginase family protein [Candidatus Roizmanbacteria bacterium]
MTNIPHRQKELNLGVEYGGDAILSDDFLKNFPHAAVDTYDFPKPEELKKEDYFSQLAKSLKKAEELIHRTLKPDEIQVAVGGDNSISFPSLRAVLDRVDASRLGYIRVDSHPDMNNISTSPTGNFHGMWMRPFVGSFEEKKIARLIDKKLTPYQLMFIGNLDINPGEQEFFTGKAHVFSGGYIRQNKESVLMNVEQFMNNYQHIYLGIDIDGFDKSIAPATGIPAQQGLFPDDIAPVVEYVKESLLCVDLVEVNPKKEGAAQTIKLAQTLLLSVLK